MEDESIRLHVSKSAVHQAVRNILKNEMNIDPDKIRNDAINEIKSKTAGIAGEVIAKFQEFYTEDQVKRIIENVIEKHVTSWKSVIQSHIETRVADELKRQMAGGIEEIIAKAAEGPFEIKVGTKQIQSKIQVIPREENPQS